MGLRCFNSNDGILILYWTKHILWWALVTEEVCEGNGGSTFEVES